MSASDTVLDEPIVVVATQKGYYGNTVRHEGERFAINSPADFAATWMVEPAKAKDLRELVKLEADFRARHARPGRGDISDAQLLSEIAQSGGRLEALRQENLSLKAKVKTLEGTISELTGQLDQLLAGAKGAGEGRTVRVDAGRSRQAKEGAESEASGAGDEGQEEVLGGQPEDGNDTGEAPAVGALRVTRRR